MRIPRRISSLTIDVTETASLALLCVMQTARPVDGNVALLAIQTGRALHAATGADAAELEQAVEDWAIVTNVELGLLPVEGLNIVGGDFLKEFDVFVGVELAHFVLGGGLRALEAS